MSPRIAKIKDAIEVMHHCTARQVAIAVQAAKVK